MLPSALTSFVGRAREVAAVSALVRTTRLLTLVGAGGVGKTRLALQVAADVADPDGVCLVELASLAEPAQVEKAVATAFDVYEQPGRPMVEVLTEALRDRRQLLVLDNCEHLLQACAELIETLLRTSAGLRVLATSRQVLRVSGETVWRVPSLSLPSSTAPTAESEAVQLFVERARAAAPDFPLTEANLATVARICRQLDGIPLALELAAARVAALSVEQIEARLVDRFALLTAGSRTALPRQQTLRGTLDWSYELLSEPQRKLLRRLAVFAGGWTLEAAEGVCASADLALTDVFDLLAQLTERSLVLAELQSTGAMRYRLLETVRQYVLQRLARDEAAEAVRLRHALFYMTLAEQADAELRGPRQTAWLDRLEREHDNLRAALAWSGSSAIGLRLAAALSWFWRLRSHFHEGRTYLRAALERADASDESLVPTPRSRALVAAGLLAFAQGDYAEATTVLDEALACARGTNDQLTIGWALHGKARVTQGSGDYVQTVAFAEASLAAFRRVGDDSGTAYSLYYVGRGLAQQGEFDRAARVGEESAALFRAAGDSWGLIWVLIHLGHIAYQQGAYERSAELYCESLVISQQIGTTWGVRNCLWGLAAIKIVLDQPAQGVRLLAAADALRLSLGLAVGAADRAHLERDMARARSALGDSAFASAWADGSMMSREQVASLALENVRRPSAEPAGALSRREREVIVLVAQGLSNREIAATLVVAPRTADTHVANSRALTKIT